MLLSYFKGLRNMHGDVDLPHTIWCITLLQLCQLLDRLDIWLLQVLLLVAGPAATFADLVNDFLEVDCYTSTLKVSVVG